MTDVFKEHSCPNCGAPLGIPEKHERFFKCDFCGTILEDHASHEEQETGVFKIKISQTEIDTARAERLPVYTTPAKKAAARSNTFGCLVGLAVTILVLGILAVSLVPALLTGGAAGQVIEELGIDEALEPVSDTSGLGGIEIYSFAATALLPSDDNTTPDFAGISRGPEDVNRLMYIDLEHTPPLRWQVEITGEDVDGSRNLLISDANLVYYSFSNRIAAYNRAQGALVWEASLSDEIEKSLCEGCFQLFGETLMTLTADGTLAARNAATGETLWQVILNETPRQVVAFGGSPAVLDSQDGEVGLQVYDLESGELSQRIVPQCPNDVFPGSPQTVSIYDPLLAAADGSAVYFFIGLHDPGCAQRWEPGSTEPTWQALFDATAVSGLDSESLLLSGDTIFMAHRRGVHSIQTTDGTFTTLLPEDEDHDFLPLAERDGVLVLMVERLRGTRRWEIWGVDAELGNVKWTFIPDTEERFEHQSMPLREGGAWLAGLTPGGLTVAHLYDDPPRVIFQTIPLLSGTAGEPVTYSLPLTTGVWATPLGWRGDEFWLLGTTTLSVVDVTTGEAIDVWP